MSSQQTHPRPQVWEEYCPHCNEYNTAYDSDIPTAEIANMPTWCENCSSKLGPYSRTKNLNRCPLCHADGNVLVTEDPRKSRGDDD